MFSKLFVLIAVSFLLTASHSESAEDLRDEIDFNIDAKASVRQERSDIHEDLHSLTGSWRIHSDDTNSKQSHLLSAYRDYFTAYQNCQALNHEMSFPTNVDELDCLPAPLHFDAQAINLAYSDNQMIETVIPPMEQFFDDWQDFISDIARKFSLYQQMQSIYYPTSAQQDYQACLDTYATEQNPEPEECDELKQDYDFYVSMVNDYGNKIGMTYLEGRGESIGRSYSAYKVVVFQHTKEQNNAMISQEEPILNQQRQSCESGLANKLYLGNSRISQRNAAKAHKTEKMNEIMIALGQFDNKVEDLESKTTDAEILAETLEVVELSN